MYCHHEERFSSPSLSLRDATFGRSVILLIDHTDEGTMGLIINKPLPIFVNDIIKEFKLYR